MTFPHSATVQKLVTVNGISTYTDSGGTPCFLQPIDAEAAELFSIVFAKGSNCFLPADADVEDSDRLTIDSTKYSVKGVLLRNYGTLKHKKAILESL